MVIEMESDLESLVDIDVSKFPMFNAEPVLQEHLRHQEHLATVTISHLLLVLDQYGWLKIKEK
jgi:hypothetical protein